MTIIENIFNSVSEAVGIDTPIVLGLTNNTKLIENSRNGYFVSSMLRKVGKEVHPALGYAGAVVGGANKYYMMNQAKDNPLEGFDLTVEMAKGSANQLFYQAIGNNVESVPLSIAGSIIPESSDSFIAGTFIGNGTLSAGCKQVATEGIMVGMDTAIITAGHVVGTMAGKYVGATVGFLTISALATITGPALLVFAPVAASSGSAFGAFAGSIVGGKLAGAALVPTANDMYKEYMSDNLASFCLDPSPLPEQEVSGSTQENTTTIDEL